MANTKQAIKMIRVSARRTQTNQRVRAALKTRIKAATQQIASKASDAPAAVVTAVSELDKAGSKGIVHPNNAARRKSRLMRKLNKAAAA